MIMERKKNRVSKEKERKRTYRGLLSQMIGTKCDEERKNVILLAVPKNLERCVHRREMRPCSNIEISLHNETPLLKQQYEYSYLLCERNERKLSSGTYNS
jgi:hypothetical protein